MRIFRLFALASHDKRISYIIRRNQSNETDRLRFATVRYENYDRVISFPTSFMLINHSWSYVYMNKKNDD